AGLTPLQEALTQQWEDTPPEVAHPTGTQALSLPDTSRSGQGAPTSELDTAAPAADSSLSQLISSLQAFEQQLPQCQEMARARLLTKALCQELELLQRNRHRTAQQKEAE